MVSNIPFEAERAVAPLRRSLRRHCDAQTFEAVRDTLPALIQTVRDTQQPEQQAENVRLVLLNQCQSVAEGELLSLDDDHLDDVSRFVVDELHRLGEADPPRRGYHAGVDSSHWLG